MVLGTGENARVCVWPAPRSRRQRRGIPHQPRDRVYRSRISCASKANLYIVIGDMWPSHLNLTSAMRFEYQLRFLLLNSLVTTRKAIRRYETAKITTDEAKRILLDTIGVIYRGEQYFGLVDRVYARLKIGFIPVYDVQLSLPEGLTLDQLLNMYDRLRIGSLKRGWCVPFFISIRRLTLRNRYISYIGGVRDMEDTLVVIDDGVRRHFDQMLASVGRVPIPWVDSA
jgi:hypothetical protein